MYKLTVEQPALVHGTEIIEREFQTEKEARDCLGEFEESFAHHGYFTVLLEDPDGVCLHEDYLHKQL